MAESTYVNLPADPAVAGKLVEAQADLDRKKLDRGLLGTLFGTRDHVPNNVAAIICVICILAICAILFSGEAFASKKDSIAVVSGILTLSLGFLFGRATKD